MCFVCVFLNDALRKGTKKKKDDESENDIPKRVYALPDDDDGRHAAATEKPATGSTCLAGVVFAERTTALGEEALSFQVLFAAL